MKKTNIRKLSIAGIFCAVAVVGGFFSFPVFASKCAPVQHMVNILCAVLLGPWYGVGVAFCASLLRNLLGLGSLMAFPGSMFGALLCGITFSKCKKIMPTLLAEVFGTSILTITANFDQVPPIEVSDLQSSLTLTATVTYQGETYSMEGRI